MFQVHVRRLVEVQVLSSAPVYKHFSLIIKDLSVSVPSNNQGVSYFHQLLWPKKYRLTLPETASGFTSSSTAFQSGSEINNPNFQPSFVALFTLAVNARLRQKRIAG